MLEVLDVAGDNREAMNDCRSRNHGIQHMGLLAPV
jgi:hypothetical protein